MIRENRVVGIDIGASHLKIVGVKRTATPQLTFFSIIDIPKDAQEGFFIDSIQRVLKENSITRPSVYLNISEESIHLRRIETPPIPKEELPSALRWQAKDRLPYEIEKACIDFKVIREFTKEDGSKGLGVMLVTCLEGIVRKKAEMFKKMNLDLLSVNVSPFALENLIRIAGNIDPAMTVVVMDVGHIKTDISFYSNRNLQFTRSIPIASSDITQALCGPLVSGADKIEFSDEQADEIKREIGIPYQPMTFEKRGISAIQILTLIRGVLERLSREIKRSIDYYTSELGRENVSEILLAGGGSLLKNLDLYLSEELNIRVRKMEMPKAVRISKSGITEKENLHVLNAVGAALDYSKKVNLLPEEYKLKKIEFVEKISLRMIAFVLAALLSLSYFSVKMRIDDYVKRVKTARAHRGVISQIEGLNAKIGERLAVVRTVEKASFPSELIMKELSHVIPANIVLNSLRLSSDSKDIEMSGVVYEKKEKVLWALTKFMEELEKSPIFKEATFGSVEDLARNEKGARFSISVAREM